MKTLLKVETEAKSLGLAQDFLRGMIMQINQGHTSGPGWKIGEGEVPKPIVLSPKIEGLDAVIAEVRAALAKGNDADALDLDPIDRLLDALAAAGYGLDKAQDAPGVGSGVEGGNKAAEGTTAAPGSNPGSTTGGDDKFPWNKK